MQDMLESRFLRALLCFLFEFFPNTLSAIVEKCRSAPHKARYSNSIIRLIEQQHFEKLVQNILDGVSKDNCFCYTFMINYVLRNKNNIYCNPYL